MVSSRGGPLVVSRWCLGVFFVVSWSLLMVSVSKLGVQMKHADWSSRASEEVFLKAA